MLQPADVAAAMEGIGIWWAVAGGWAIDLWLGRVTREHHDIEIAIRRGDQLILHEALCDSWNLSCLDPPSTSWRPWLRSHTIEAPAFQIKARRDEDEFDVFLETMGEEQWVFRRDDRIRRPRHALTVGSDSGIPVIAPEVQLLYMATSLDVKNEGDFDNASEQLDQRSARWLSGALAHAHPDHPWLARLPAT